MALTCTLCDDPRAPDIDAALSDGATHRNVARTFGLSRHVVDRHVRGGRAILATLHPGLRHAIRENAEAFARAALGLYWPAVVEVAHELDEKGVVIGSWVARLVKPTTLRVVGGKE
jgi:hypothetical protein